MAQRGGYREGAGRKKGLASVQAEKARDILVTELMDSWLPIVRKAVKQALVGDKAARDWLTNHGLGEALKRFALEDPDDVLKNILITKHGEKRGDKSTSKAD